MLALGRPDGDCAVVVTGELDTCTRPTAQIALDLAHGPGPIVLDLSVLSFCCADGLALLIGPTRINSGHDYVLTGLPSSPHRR